MMATFWRKGLDEGSKRVWYSAEVEPSGFLEMSSSLNSLSHLITKIIYDLTSQDYLEAKTTENLLL